MKLTGVALSVTASHAMRQTFAFVNVYVAFTSRVPGKPPSPSGLRSDSSSPSDPSSAVNGRACQTLSWKPAAPPCSVHGRPSGQMFVGSAYRTPSTVNAPAAMRFA